MARAHIRHWGVATVEDVAVAADAAVLLPQKLLPILPGFRWLDESSGWFWIENTPRNSLPTQMRKVLAASPRINIAELRAGVGRHHRKKGFAPIVARAGMSYVHIPVNFQSPQPADFTRFVSIMNAWHGQRLFVHCAANMRVSAFLFLHRTLRDPNIRPKAEHDLRCIWHPGGVWREFINRHLDAVYQSPFC